MSFNVNSNEYLTQTEKGTPGGELLRRYWHPICVADAIPSDSQKLKIRLLGENLIVFRKPNGDFGLVAENCLHRSASLYYGFIEDEGIRCPYHGWLFNEEGICIERPFEPETIPKISNRLPSYSIENLNGILFGYLGPSNTKPLLPRWDILVRNDGIRTVEIQEDLNCNWLQIQENAADVTHTYFLHSYVFNKLGIKDESGFNRPLTQYGFQPFKWGILKSWTYSGCPPQLGWGNPLIFPNMLRIMTQMHWRIPIDNVTTRIFWITFTPQHEELIKDRGATPQIIKQPVRQSKNGEYLMNTFMSQDAMAVETQGKIANRTTEILGYSDKGIIMFRRMLKEQIEAVQQGTDPMALVRKESENICIDLREWMGGDVPASCEKDSILFHSKPYEEIFNEHHEIVKLPRRDILEALQ
jgi:5,5'-dehydrodivanillate O-demethylase oxygenase subunit